MWYYTVLLRDQFVQKWHESIELMPKLDYFRMYKNDFCFEEYLNIVDNSKLRRQLSILRLSSHTVEIATGRYIWVERNATLCKYCS
jgi:hypothetical protein